MTDTSITKLCTLLNLLNLVEKLRYENCHIKQPLKEKAIKIIDAQIEEALEKLIADDSQRMSTCAPSDATIAEVLDEMRAHEFISPREWENM